MLGDTIMSTVKEIHWDLSELHDSILIDDTIPLFDSIKDRSQLFSNQYVVFKA